MSNATIQVPDLLGRAAAEQAEGAVTDQLYGWLEELYRAVRELGWTWNQREFEFLSYAALTEIPTVTYVEGNNYMDFAAPVLNGFAMTGRRVQLGDDLYRVTDYGLSSSTRVYVHRAIRGSATAAASPTFYRDVYHLRTSRITSIHLDNRKLPRLDARSRDQAFGMLTDRYSVGRPRGYYDERHWELSPPAYPLTVAASGAGAFDDGTYLYFATRYDAESGQESPPGPTTTYTSQAALAPTVTYANPAVSGQGEDTSYYIRIYRSQKNPGRDRPAMYLLNEQSPLAGTPYKDIHTGTLYHLPAYYDGVYTAVRFSPGPDTRYGVRVQAVNAWGGRLAGTDYLNLGENNEITELFRLYAAGLISGLKKGDAGTYRSQIIAFRQQMAFLLNKSRGAGTGDITVPGNFGSTATSGEKDSSDWVNNWPWGQDY